MSEDIARTELDVLWPDGRRVRTTVAVGLPYHDGHLRAWRCPVRLDGLVSHMPDIGGEDSLQALLLALRVAHQQLAQAEATGARLLLVGEEPDDPESGFDLKSYFGG
jgi:hypothetical protein